MLSPCRRDWRDKQVQRKQLFPDVAKLHLQEFLRVSWCRLCA